MAAGRIEALFDRAVATSLEAVGGI